MTYIETAACYTPRYRVSADEIKEGYGSFDARGIKSKAVPAPDEDIVTMAIEALQSAINQSSHGRNEISEIHFAATAPPNDEGDITAQITEMLGLNNEIKSTTYTQSRRDGVNALINAAQAHTDEPIAVVASAAPKAEPNSRHEHAAGAGATAFIICNNGDAAIEETSHYSVEYSGVRFRERGNRSPQSYDATQYERNAYIDTIKDALKALDAEASAYAPTAVDVDLPYRIPNGGDKEIYEYTTRIGDTGCASAFFGLLEAWRNGEEDIAVIGYGDGSTSDIIRISGSLNVGTEQETVDLSYPEYLRYRGFAVPTGGDA